MQDSAAMQVTWFCFVCWVAHHLLVSSYWLFNGYWSLTVWAKAAARGAARRLLASQAMSWREGSKRDETIPSAPFISDIRKVFNSHNIIYHRIDTSKSKRLALQIRNVLHRKNIAFSNAWMLDAALSFKQWTMEGKWKQFLLVLAWFQRAAAGSCSGSSIHCAGNLDEVRRSSWPQFVLASTGGACSRSVASRSSWGFL